MPDNPRQNPQKFIFHRLKTGFGLLIAVSLAAIILTFLAAVSDIAFGFKLVGFLLLTAIYLVSALLILKNQPQQTVVDSIEIEKTEETVQEEKVFSAEIEDKLSALEEASAIFSNSLKSADMFRLVSNRIREILPFSISVLYLFDKNISALKVSYMFGGEFPLLFDDVLPTTAGIAGKTFQNGTVERTQDLSFEKNLFQAEDVKKLNSAIGCPLFDAADCYGVLALYDVREDIYTKENEIILAAIGTRISPLFINSLTFENNLNNALSDSITNLPNERALFMMLENQVAESQRFREQRPLTVLSIDIKEFSSVNSRYGHAVGDRILSFTAKNIKDQLRQMDFLSRISGDEFLAVLPTSSDATTEMIISRIQKTFAANPFEIDAETKIHVTLNFGLASFIKDGETAQDLINIAAVKKHEAKSPIKSTILWFPKEYSN